MLMASDVAIYLVKVIAKYGDLPCVLKHQGDETDDAIIDPLNSLPVVTFYKYGSKHKETCILFSKEEIPYRIE